MKKSPVSTFEDTLRYILEKEEALAYDTTMVFPKAASSTPVTGDAAVVKYNSCLLTTQRVGW